MLAATGMLLAPSGLVQAEVGNDTSRTHSRASHTALSSAAAFKDLESQFERALVAENVPAAALVVVNATEASSTDTLIRTFGNATPDTPFRLGSITKTFTALALLHAAQQTGTALNTPLTTLLDKDLWRNDWSEHRPITLSHLIELSAGFSDLSHQEFSSAVPVAREQALKAHSASHRSFWPPGEFHSYSNLPPAFSAAVIEKLSGQTLSQYLTRNVLIPAGMTSAGLAPDNELPGGYKADGVTPIPYWHMIYPAFGALNATPREFSRFLYQLTSNTLHSELKKAAAHRGDLPLYQPQTTSAARAGLRLGYGAGMYGWESHGHLFFGHGGDADGYRSRYAVAPDLERGYFLVINTDNPKLVQKLRKLLERFLTNQAPRAEPKRNPSAINAEHVQALQKSRKFAGTYVRSTLRFGAERITNCTGAVATLKFTNTAATWTRGKKTLELVALGERLFRLKREQLASIVLIEESNRRTLQGELGNWTHIDDHESCRAIPNE